MCGIAGIVAFDRDEIVNPRRLTEMRDAIAHRGPDGEGLMIDGAVGLAHRRLAIVDVEGGHQPMPNEDQSAWVVFNGEIYNHADLRPALAARGHVYRTRSDTETILHLYDEYGEAGFERLEGMFAFALWDGLRRRLVLARDRLGIKPLYYSQTLRELVFASEIKALVVGGVRPRFNARVLPEFLATRYVAGDETFFEDVRRVEPGHVLTWSADEGVRTRQYWQVPPLSAGPRVSMRTAAGQLRDELREAVRRHLMSDVPLGVFLSGGIDSSALAALASELVPDPLRTFSVGFHEAEGNELPYARSVAGAIGADHREVKVSAGEFFNALPELIWRQDEPLAFTSNVPLYFVSRLAREHVKVVLTGEGADELLLGYNRYRVTFWNERLGRPYWTLAPAAVRRGIRGAIHHLPSGLRRYAERSFLAMEQGQRSLFFENFAVFPDRLQAALGIGGEGSADPYAFALRCYDAAPGGSLDRMSATDLQTYLCELLMKQDRMSMAASIESRVPFLDDRFVAAVAALPARLKLSGWTTKAVLRRAVADLLPPAILNRRKMGFPVPLGGWLRNGHRSMVDEFVLGGRTRERHLFHVDALRRLADEHVAGRANHAERLWLLINLEIWLRIFCDGEAPADVLRPVWRRTGVAAPRTAGPTPPRLRIVPPVHVPAPVAGASPFGAQAPSWCRSSQEQHQ
jgi:asparagine synthase (glutamine-hydrolysing)